MPGGTILQSKKAIAALTLLGAFASASHAQTEDELIAARLQVFDKTMAVLRDHHYLKGRYDALAADIERVRVDISNGRQDFFEAVDALAQSFDSRTSFSKIVFKKMKRDANALGFAALGLSTQKTGARLLVDRVFFNTSGFGAGLKRGDAIVSIDGKSVTEMNTAGIDEAVCNDFADFTKIGIVRSKGKAVIQHDLECNYDTEHAVEMRVINDKIGYIKIDSFVEFVDFDVQEAIQTMRKNHPGVKSYILDLRDNPGGQALAAQSLVDLFVDSADISMIKKIRDDSGNVYNTPGDHAQAAPLVVLVNHDSWSAAELVPMALQYHRRAKIVGTITGGKGTSQRTFSIFPNRLRSFFPAGALTITESVITMPDGNSHQLKGVIPDVQVLSNLLPAKAPREADMKFAIPNPMGGALTPAEKARTETCEVHADFKGAAVYGHDGKIDPILTCGVMVLRNQTQAKAAAFVPR